MARLDRAAAGVPAAPPLLKFRRRLETHDRCQGLLAALHADRTARGLRRRAGTWGAATRIAAPPSTQNQQTQRAPERQPTRKGKHWYFGLKAPSGAERDRKRVPPVGVPAANVADVPPTAARRHGPAKQGPAAAGYPGVEKRAELLALERKMDWQSARKRGQIKTMKEGQEKETLQAVEKAKASGRAFVAPPFPLRKNIFRHRKGRSRGLAKNGPQRYTLCGLANGVIGGRTATT